MEARITSKYVGAAAIKLTQEALLLVAVVLAGLDFARLPQLLLLSDFQSRTSSPPCLATCWSFLHPTIP